MNDAIWARVTGSSGQNNVFCGGLHPLAIPAVAIVRDVVFERRFGDVCERGDRACARLETASQNAAIWARVSGSFGQNSVLSGGLQPLVIPAARIAAMSAANGESATSPNGLSSDGASWKARARNAAIWPRLTTSSGQ